MSILIVISFVFCIYFLIKDKKNFTIYLLYIVYTWIEYVRISNLFLNYSSIVAYSCVVLPVIAFIIIILLTKKGEHQ